MEFNERARLGTKIPLYVFSGIYNAKWKESEDYGYSVKLPWRKKGKHI